MSTLTLKGISLRVADKTLLGSLDAEILPGQILSIVGRSGTGKSSLLAYLCGVLPAAFSTSGRVLIDGEDLTALPPERRGFGILFQAGALWSSLTLAENVALPLQEFTSLTPDLINEVVSLKLSLVGLGGFEDFYPSEISGGMKKRAGLARAMALDPGILFFDEPSAGLDPLSSRRLDDLILELRDSLGATVVLVTHELPSIFAIANNAVFLDADTRTMIAYGDPRELAEHGVDKVRTFLKRGEA